MSYILLQHLTQTLKERLFTLSQVMFNDFLLKTIFKVIKFIFIAVVMYFNAPFYMLTIKNILSFTDGNDGDSFELDATNGNLTIKTGLDFGTTVAYTLKISANDSLNTATLNLTINVKTGKCI